MIALDDVLVTAYSPDPAGGADRVVRLLGPVTLELVEHRVAIVGANGSGKSTLARLLNGLVLPSSGTVRVDGLDTARDGAAVRRKVGFMFTDPDAQLVMPTPVEDVALSLRRLPMTPAERDVAARAALARFGLADRAEVPVHALSGGQRQLLALASVLATEPAILVCDEPTTLLDLRWRGVVDALLADLEQQVVVVTHDLDAALQADRVLVVDDGSVVFDGDPAQAVAHYRALMQVRRVSGPIRPPWAGPLGLYHPGTTVIHRAPAGLKLAFLAVFAIAVVAVRGPASALAFLGVALLAQLVARIPWHRTTRGLVPALVTAALIGAYQWWARGWATAVEVSVDLVALVLLGAVVTATTRADTLLDALARLARPLRHVGLSPDVGRAVGRPVPAHHPGPGADVAGDPRRRPRPRARP